MSQKFPLSIVIPTYNRPEPLLRLLEQLIELQKEYVFDISISDNASTCSYADVVDFCSKNDIFYQSNNTNLGIDRNMEITYSLGFGTFVWALADDETIFEHMFCDLYSRLGEAIDLFLLTGARLEDVKETSGQQIEVYNDPLDAFRDYWGATTFGLLVFRRALLADVIFNRYYGSYHAYTAVIWEALAIKMRKSEPVEIQALLLPVVRLHPEIEKTWSSFKVDVIYRSIPLFFKELDSYYSKVSDWFYSYYMHKQLTACNILRFTSDTVFCEEQLKQLCVEMSEDERDSFRRIYDLPRWLKKSMRLLYRFYPFPIRTGFHARIAYKNKMKVNSSRMDPSNK